MLFIVFDIVLALAWRVAASDAFVPPTTAAVALACLLRSRMRSLVWPSIRCALVRWSGSVLYSLLYQSWYICLLASRLSFCDSYPFWAALDDCQPPIRELTRLVAAAMVKGSIFWFVFCALSLAVLQVIVFCKVICLLLQNIISCKYCKLYNKDGTWSEGK